MNSEKRKINSRTVFIALLLLFISGDYLYSNKITIYYYYDPLTDKTTFTNQCHDLRVCKPLYQTKGEVKHKKGYRLTPGNENGYDHLIKKASERYGVDFFLIKSVIKAESLFDINAVSTAGAKGLMQLMPGTAKEVGVNDIFDAEQNIMGGTAYLRKMLNRFKDNKNALAAYNAGPAAVTYYKGVPPFRETRDYVEKVANFYYSYTGKKLW
jgi:soluble lytic murein transglycosylase-like protein